MDNILLVYFCWILKQCFPCPSFCTFLTRKAINCHFQDAETELEDKKYELLGVIRDTQRGLVTTADQRSVIEEALVSFFFPFLFLREGYVFKCSFSNVVLIFHEFPK